MLRERIRSCYASKHFISTSEKARKTMQIFRSASAFRRIYRPCLAVPGPEHLLAPSSAATSHLSLSGGLCPGPPAFESPLMWLMHTPNPLCRWGCRFNPAGTAGMLSTLSFSSPFPKLHPSSSGWGVLSLPCDSSGQIASPGPVGHQEFGKSTAPFPFAMDVAADNGRPGQ